MAKKGRPFTYQSDEERPVTISLRLAHDLYDRLERHAQRHRQSVSELVRDGIEMRLAVQADPRWQTAQEQELYYDNTVLQELATPAHFLDDRIPFDDEHLPVSAPATPAVADISHDNNTVIQEAVTKHRGRKGQAAAVQQDQSPALVEDTPGHSDEAPAYDPSKYHLGKLCPRGHEYQGTGQSLRSNNVAGYCPACNVEDTRARRQARRQAQSPSRP